MNIRIDIKHNKATYRVRYVKFTEDLKQIYNMKPRGCYKYCLMDTVIFHDFETMFDAVVENYKAAHNDNKSKKRV